ncbi:MAG: hypothetical protein GY851_03295 [bacterium]|nr:hypothetical protein [bacterium]
MKRYEPEAGDVCGGEYNCAAQMVKDADGAWVKYDDAEKLRKALEIIAEFGGRDAEECVRCNGSWCAEQARRALE